MKKFLVMFLMVVFAFGTMIITGCGGGSEGQKVKSAADEEGQVMDEAKQKAKEELPNTYLVEKGDTLYSIAEKPEIYGNKYQWPVIFDANKDIIDDFKTVNEGQRLIIPRNITAVDIEKAKQKATELNWPPAENVTTTAQASGKEEGIQEGAVAGISTEKHVKKHVSAAPVEKKEASVAEASASNTEEQPTPIPEPSKKAKKGGQPNILALLLILLGIAAVVIYFIIAGRNKKKEEDDEEKEEKSDNILG
ncbi:MAG: LysM peptidoglycan-binding domain-containing protein [Candidatus Goldiibacteriota bacterium]|jgi:LysM repeat protein